MMGQTHGKNDPDVWWELPGFVSTFLLAGFCVYVWWAMFPGGVIPGTHTLIPDKRGHDRASWRSARANARPQARCVAIAEENDSRGTRRRGGAACKVNGQKRVAVVWILLHNRCEAGERAYPEPRFHAPRSALRSE